MNATDLLFDLICYDVVCIGHHGQLLISCEEIL